MKKIVYWSAAELTLKTLLAIKHAEKEKSKVILVDFKEFIPDIYKYFSIPYKPKSELIRLYETGKNDIENFIDVKNGLHIFTGFDEYESLKFTHEHMKYIIESLNYEFATAIFDVNGGITYSNTFAALKSADEINVVMEPNNLSYYITAVTVNFIVRNWSINKDKMIGIITKKGDIETAKAITELKNIKVERI